MDLSYDRYLDQILGGWIGKSIGGAVGARFEGNKGWIDVRPEELFPEVIPPNDDLDLQVLWLRVLEERGASLTADDLSSAWLERCWYPFNEYGIFRRNWRLGIHPPLSGRLANQFWETGMGCPIRAEIWGYVFPGAPDLAAHFAGMDGSLDHTQQSIGAERMLAAMASMAFFVHDVRRLIATSIHYLPSNTTITRLVRAALQAYDDGLCLHEARERLMLLEGTPEACDARVNVPFALLSLLYGAKDLQDTVLSAIHCGYDTDCTAATSAALVGQILGATQVPTSFRTRVGDELVMGIEYRRPEMTLTALARDTARVGVLMTKACNTGTGILDAPRVEPFPLSGRRPTTRLVVDYGRLPVAAPGDTITATIRVEGEIPSQTQLTVTGPRGWTISPDTMSVDRFHSEFVISLQAPGDIEEWPMRNMFTASLGGDSRLNYTFGVVGANLWQFLGVYYDPLPDESDPVQKARGNNHHFVSLRRAYISEPTPDVTALYRSWSTKLGRPAIIAAYEHEIDPGRLVGLDGAYCIYLNRIIVSPKEQSAYIVIGNNDSYRLYLNGEMVAEIDEYVSWAPFNNVHRVVLRAGANRLLLKLLKRGDALRFTLGLRGYTGRRKHNHEDWLVDLADVNPGTALSKGYRQSRSQE